MRLSRLDANFHFKVFHVAEASFLKPAKRDCRHLSVHPERSSVTAEENVDEGSERYKRRGQARQ